jgi:hypothetical protein
MVFKPTSLPGSKFSGGAPKKSAPAPVAAAPKKATGSAIKGKPAAATKVKKDMTWGGRYVFHTASYIYFMQFHIYNHNFYL